MASTNANSQVPRVATILPKTTVRTPTIWVGSHHLIWRPGTDEWASQGGGWVISQAIPYPAPAQVVMHNRSASDHGHMTNLGVSGHTDCKRDSRCMTSTVAHNSGYASLRSQIFPPIPQLPLPERLSSGPGHNSYPSTHNLAWIPPGGWKSVQATPSVDYPF